jgi:thiamine biosynthesis lipoprotein
MPRIDRRRLLIVGALGGLALAGGLPARAEKSGRSLHRWRGSALGAEAEIQLLHPEGQPVGRLVTLALDEIDRLERIFSLYRPDSALAQLNREGRLERPPLDLVTLLGQAQMLAERSDGAFDPTVQPLYALYAQHFAVPGAAPSGPPRKAVEAALRRVDWQAIAVSPARIVLQRPGMAVTLNGIAQGYIADRVGERLAALGVTDALLALGEIRALGSARDGQPWRAGIADGAAQAQPVALGTAAGAYPALATSAAAGTVFERSGRTNHLLDPRTGESAAIGRTVTVAAGTAALADGLSTALAILPDAERQRLAGGFPGIRIFHST